MREAAGAVLAPYDGPVTRSRSRSAIRTITDKESSGAKVLDEGGSDIGVRERPGKAKGNLVDSGGNRRTGPQAEKAGWGGVGLDLPHGSLLLECARFETHSTTPIRDPNGREPKRAALIFYTNVKLNEANHGHK